MADAPVPAPARTAPPAAKRRKARQGVKASKASKGAAPASPAASEAPASEAPASEALADADKAQASDAPAAPEEGEVQASEGVAPAEEAPEPQGGGASAPVVTPPPPAAGKRTFHYVLDSETNQISSYTEKVNGKVVLCEKRPAEADGREYKFWRLWESSQLKLARQDEDLKAFAQIRQLCKSTTAKGKAARQAQGGRGRAGAAPAPPLLVVQVEDGPPRCLAPPSASSPGDNGLAPVVRPACRPLPEAVAVEIRRRFVLDFDAATANKHGHSYCTPAEGKGGSLCGGGFPHAVLKPHPAGRGQAAPDEEDCYYCVESKAMHLRVYLKEHMPDGSLQPAYEHELLELMRAGTTAVERSSWGAYDEQLILHFSLEFAPDESADSQAHEQDLRINPAIHFKKALTPAKLLVPHESEVYRAGSYEIPMVNGMAACSAKLNRGVTTPNLVEHHKNQSFEWVARCLHPSLRGLPEFTVRSLPFRTKAVLTNEVNPNERFVRMPNGEVVPSPPEDCPLAAGA